MTLREFFKSPFTALLEAELVRVRHERAEERRYWAKELAKATVRADRAETYSRELAEAVLEKRAGVRPVSLPRPVREKQDPGQEVGYVPLTDAQARLQALEAEARIRYGENGAEVVPR